jgi:hypothetical protein
MKGKRVDVFFGHADALFNVLCEYEPCNVGDSWVFRSADGCEHRAVLFERMSEAPQNAMVAQNTSTNTARDEICLCLSCSRLQFNGGSCQPNTNSFVTACGGYSGKLSPVA